MVLPITMMGLFVMNRFMMFMMPMLFMVMHRIVSYVDVLLLMTMILNEVMPLVSPNVLGMLHLHLVSKVSKFRVVVMVPSLNGGHNKECGTYGNSSDCNRFHFQTARGLIEAYDLLDFFSLSLFLLTLLSQNLDLYLFLYYFDLAPSLSSFL